MGSVPYKLHLATGCQGSRFVQVFQFAVLQVPMQLQVSSVLVSDHGFELFARSLSYGERFSFLGMTV